MMTRQILDALSKALVAVGTIGLVALSLFPAPADSKRVLQRQ